MTEGCFVQTFRLEIRTRFCSRGRCVWDRLRPRQLMELRSHPYSTDIRPRLWRVSSGARSWNPRSWRVPSSPVRCDSVSSPTYTPPRVSAGDRELAQRCRLGNSEGAHPAPASHRNDTHGSKGTKALLQTRAWKRKCGTAVRKLEGHSPQGRGEQQQQPGPAPRLRTCLTPGTRKDKPFVSSPQA